MGSEAPTPLVAKVKLAVSNPVNRAGTSKKSMVKVPKRIHKSEREKLKRDQLNSLFLELASALELTEPNNGKASILCEATRLLKDLFVQIENLKKENVNLLSESHYVAVEKNELKEENSALESQIGELRNEVEAKLAQSKPDLNKPPTEFQQRGSETLYQGCLNLAAAKSALPQTPAVFVLPVNPVADSIQIASKPNSHVSKPHARYPTPSDSWPFQLLGVETRSKERSSA